MGMDNGKQENGMETEGVKGQGSWGGNRGEYRIGSEVRTNGRDQGSWKTGIDRGSRRNGIGKGSKRGTREQGQNPRVKRSRGVKCQKEKTERENSKKVKGSNHRGRKE